MELEKEVKKRILQNNASVIQKALCFCRPAQGEQETLSEEVEQTIKNCMYTSTYSVMCGLKIKLQDSILGTRLWCRGEKEDLDGGGLGFKAWMVDRDTKELLSVNGRGWRW
ncbi:hypothetical protein HOLleu_42687 [Holothuria leucospilota]|uniref:Uncharacterized protein n=1 Tax=Holothuria leucospilota TaxID=206669 RepID=A0A9Q0YCP8_HOLLE|nr:hypothetical protein HOLleu_42687 [Holothuria leucospilota]